MQSNFGFVSKQKKALFRHKKSNAKAVGGIEDLAASLLHAAPLHSISPDARRFVTIPVGAPNVIHPHNPRSRRTRTCIDKVLKGHLP